MSARVCDECLDVCGDSGTPKNCPIHNAGVAWQKKRNQLLNFYQVKTADELIDRMERQIERLQEKLTEAEKFNPFRIPDKFVTPRC